MSAPPSPPPPPLPPTGPAGGATTKTKSAALIGGGAALLALVAKGKGLLVALKALSVGKVLLTFGTMFASIAYYAGQSGWAFGVGLVLIILIHELGHGVAIRSAGLAA